MTHAVPGRVAGMIRPPAVTFTFDGRPMPGHPGESVAAALLAAGRPNLGPPSSDLGIAAPRAPFCLMGTCQQCLVRVAGRLEQSCLLPVRAGLAVMPA